MNLQRQIHTAFPQLHDAGLYADGRRAGLDNDTRHAPDSPDWREGFRRGRYLAQRTVVRNLRNLGAVRMEEIGDGTVQVYRMDGSPIGYPVRVM